MVDSGSRLSGVPNLIIVREFHGWKPVEELR